MITLSLCMVVGSNIGNLPECLDSATEIADEIIIVSTVSNNDLKGVCGNHKCRLYELKSNNKSDAWNFAFGTATMDYILWLQQEDVFLDEDREKLKKLKSELTNSVDVVRMPHSIGGTSCIRNRIVRRTGYYVWQSGLNCYLPANGEKIIEADILVTSAAKQEDITAQKLSVFEERLEAGKKLSSREIYYYAQRLQEQKLYDKAIEYYKLFFDEKDGWIGDKLIACDKVADIYRTRGDRQNELRYIFKAFEYDLPRAELLCRLGTIFAERGELDKAIYWYKLAASLDRPEDNLGFLKEDCWTWLPHLKLCGCYYKIGDYENANKHNEEALKYKACDITLMHNKEVLKGLIDKGSPMPIKSELNLTNSNSVQDPFTNLHKPLKIVQVAPDVYPVPPENYGGIEIVVYELTEQLVKMGHEVYLYAPEGSKTSAKLIPYMHKTKNDSGSIADYVIKTLPQGVNIIHDHTLNSALGKQNLQIPTVCTIHGTINYRVKYPVFVSKRALEVIGGNHGFYVYNGLNLSEYEYSEEKQDYMLYLGRLDKYKGLDYALEVAEKTKKRLVIAGPVHDTGYYAREVEPRIKNNSNIEYIGPVGGKKKQEIIKHAQCLLFPTSWEEPFGLVMIEAMACGTPILAFANGAVPEVLRDFPEMLCCSAEEMADKAMKSAYPDSAALRKYALSRFTSEKMAQGYSEIYKKVCKEQADAENATEPVCPKSLEPISPTPASVISGSKYGKKLRIVQVAPITFPCPPKDYGGIERVIYDLTEELVHQGHEVYLFAADGSISSGNLILYDKSIDDASKVGAFVARNLPKDVDIIHDHTHSCVMNECCLSIPVINTMHDSRQNTAKYPVYLCKKALQKVGNNKGFFAYNGINPGDYEFCESKEDYLLFMGMLYSHKGVNFAFDIAEKTGKRLILAGPIYNLDYYKKEIEPRIKGNPNIVYAGSVGGSYRQLILKRAKCVLFPSVWEEPFGLVMIEAMACGTPVLAFGNGAVPEVMSGFPQMICNNVEEMLYKLQNQKFPEPQVLRKYVEDTFSAGKMADRYVEIYKKVIEDKHQ